MTASSSSRAASGGCAAPASTATARRDAGCSPVGSERACSSAPSVGVNEETTRSWVYTGPSGPSSSTAACSGRRDSTPVGHHHSRGRGVPGSAGPARSRWARTGRTRWVPSQRSVSFSSLSARRRSRPVASRSRVTAVRKAPARRPIPSWVTSSGSTSTRPGPPGGRVRSSTKQPQADTLITATGPSAAASLSRSQPSGSWKSSHPSRARMSLTTRSNSAAAVLRSSGPRCRATSSAQTRSKRSASSGEAAARSSCRPRSRRAWASRTPRPCSSRTSAS